jgi:hypothetical protein
MRERERERGDMCVLNLIRMVPLFSDSDAECAACGGCLLDLALRVEQRRRADGQRRTTNNM